MLTIISPAKKLDFESPVKSSEYSLHKFSKETNEIIEECRKMSVADIRNLMGVSDKISELNYDRYQRFEAHYNLNNSKQAIFAFKGDVYVNIDIDNYGQDELSFTDKHVAILSGLYGILRPMDLMQPYRLEMGTKFKTHKGNNLYDFWGSKITDFINNRLASVVDPALINLASNEYFSVLQPKNIKGKVINIAFKERKDSGLKVIGLLSKKARWMMVDYIVKNKINKPENLKAFNSSRYQYIPDLSDDSNMIFVR